MDQLLSSMLWPLLACIILVGIHVYLGLHVLMRQVIFVDLALAQIAALGSILGVVLGYSVDEFPWHNKMFAFGLASLGALFFALIRQRGQKIGQEAIVGISFVVALSLALLLSTKLSHGADELSELFSGNILWVLPDQVMMAAALYAVVGAFHFIFRKQFFAVSADATSAKAAGISVGWWDFWFYFSFAMVVTSSVSIAGVLLVFGFLVIPASASFLIFESLRARLIFGWVLGTLVSVLGAVYTYRVDLPTGPVIVVMLAIVLAVSAILAALLKKPK